METAVPIPGTDGLCLQREVEMHFVRGHMPESIESAKVAIEFARNTKDLAGQSAAHLLRARIAVGAGDPRTAEIHLHQCLTLQPGEHRPECYLLLGLAARLRRMPTELCVTRLVTARSLFGAQADLDGVQSSLVVLIACLLERRDLRRAEPLLNQLQAADQPAWACLSAGLRAWATWLHDDIGQAAVLAADAGCQALLRSDHQALVLSGWIGAEAALAIGDASMAKQLVSATRRHMGALYGTPRPSPNQVATELVREAALGAAQRRLPRLQRQLRAQLH